MFFISFSRRGITDLGRGILVNKVGIGLLVFWQSLAFAKVEPPNYNFSMEALQVFYPDRSLESIQKQYGKGELYESRGDRSIYKFYITQIQYKFPVFVQLKENNVIAFWSVLPTYFFHDIFHQGLIDRYGKQDVYFKKERSAVYIWNRPGNLKLIYSGQCSLTCFPRYFSGQKLEGLSFDR